jgi:hypothetical protein
MRATIWIGSSYLRSRSSRNAWVVYGTSPRTGFFSPDEISQKYECSPSKFVIAKSLLLISRPAPGWPGSPPRRFAPMGMAAVIYKKGAPDNFVWEETKVGSPERGQVRLRSTAVGVNFADTYHPSRYPAPDDRGRSAGCRRFRRSWRDRGVGLNVIQWQVLWNLDQLVSRVKALLTIGSEWGKAGANSFADGEPGDARTGRNNPEGRIRNA